MKTSMTRKPITLRQRLQARHYLRHGVQSCSKCQQGFNVYWITYRGNFPVNR